MQVQFLGPEDRLEVNGNHYSILDGKFKGQRSLALQSIGSQELNTARIPPLDPSVHRVHTGLLFFQHYMVVNTNLFLL